MFGNIIIIISLFFYGCLVQLLRKPMPGGDYGVGYAYSWIFCVAGFIISTGLLALNMNLNHCFDWLPESFLPYRNWLVFFGWLAFDLTIIWSLESQHKKRENGIPLFLGWFTWSKVYFWLPLLMLIPSLYLINAERVIGFATNWVKIPIQTGFTVSSLIALSLFGLFAKSWVSRRLPSFQVLRARRQEGKAAYKEVLSYVDNYNEPTIAGLLKYMDRGYDKQLRNNAIAKIKSFDHWENDLIAFLAQKDLEKMSIFNDETTHVIYAFLDGNKVPYPEKFIQPIKYSLKVMIYRVRKDLDDPYARELWKLNIDAVCRVLEAQFKQSAAEFRPSMLKLQKALAVTAPERKSKPHRKWYNKRLKAYRLAVKNWLDANP